MVVVWTLFGGVVGGSQRHQDAGAREAAGEDHGTP
jgi:hypothetical protein